ncbi:MAG: YggT family protein [Dehalococcoidia bacterium]|nr:YggT family protein [Dehalococcoidia bacterium]
METIATLIKLLCYVLIGAIFIRVILSWFYVRPGNPIAVIVYQITEPILGPLRRVIPRTGMFDFAPTAAIFLLYMFVILVEALT